jgi:sugar phosphate isomerase/epimerase
MSVSIQPATLVPDMPTSRRRFLGFLATACATAKVLSAPRQPERLPLAFSTLGCPRWDWATVLARARQWGYAAIELRGLQGEMDLAKRPEFQGTRLAGSLKDLEANDLRICDLGSSVRLHEVDPAVRAAQLDEGRRFIDLAHALGSPYVRVFGDRILPDQPRAASIGRVVSGLRELGLHAKGSGVVVLIESHGDFCDSPTLLEILEGVQMPGVGLLWDARHTVVMGKEAPADTLQRLGRYLRHTHLKDSRPEGRDGRYVLTGGGTVPVRDIVGLLVRRHYAGYYSLEWEKVWHPEIEEPEVAFPHFAKVMREYFAEAGYPPA